MQSEGWLLAARAVQGLGAAIGSPAALSILTTTFSDVAERNRALAIWSSVGGAATAVGMLLGGLLTTELGGEWVLFVNLPIGFACAILAPKPLDESRAEGRTRSLARSARSRSRPGLRCSSTRSSTRSPSAGDLTRRW